MQSQAQKSAEMATEHLLSINPTDIANIAAAQRAVFLYREFAHGDFADRLLQAMADEQETR